MPNIKFQSEGSTGTKGQDDFQTFNVEVDGYSEDQVGFDLLTQEYGISRIVKAINYERGVAAVNGERRRLTQWKVEAKNKKAAAMDEYLAASTDAERKAVLKKYGLS